MSPDLSSACWQLPGPRKFVQRIGMDLRDGVSQIIFAPPSLELAAFRQALWDCMEKDLYLHTFSIDPSLFEGAKPFDVLRKTFPDLTKSQYLEKAVDNPNLPDVISVENIENCSVPRCQEWINSSARWAEACRSSGAKHSLVILLKTGDTQQFKLPQTDVRLKYRVLAGFPSSLEVRLLCRLETNEINAENQWREYILASLAGNDLSLCELLWEEVFNPLKSIQEALRKYGEERGWEKVAHNSKLQNWRPQPPGLEVTPSPTDKTFDLLSSGITIYTPEYGEEIHPGLLALNKNEEDIIHRIWRAQAALLLPLVDDVRRRICNHFTARHGEGWAVVDQTINTPPLEMGKLRMFFDALPNNSWEKRQWGLGVQNAWMIRNDLAHYTPVSYEAYREFWRLSSNVHATVN